MSNEPHEPQEEALVVSYYTQQGGFDFVRVRWQTGETQDFRLDQLHELVLTAYTRGHAKGFTTGKNITDAWTSVWIKEQEPYHTGNPVPSVEGGQGNG